MNVTVADLYALIGGGPIGTAATPCHAEDPDLFFAEGPTATQAAKSICQACPVRQQCLTGALNRGEPWGVWGGELVVNGSVVAHKRARGRPRKVEAAV